MLKGLALYVRWQISLYGVVEGVSEEKMLMWEIHNYKQESSSLNLFVQADHPPVFDQTL
jgi:hypothetical protein